MTPNRAELLRIIADISRLNPDLRLGQLLTTLAMRARDGHDDAVWNCEDDEFLPAARRMLEHYQRCETEPVSSAAE
jgi:hypothetical protein